jgi:hypothetical protein
MDRLYNSNDSVLQVTRRGNRLLKQRNLLMKFAIAAAIYLILAGPFQQSYAGGTGYGIVHKPDWLWNPIPDTVISGLTLQDRVNWKSVINWCNECDRRAAPTTHDNRGSRGGITFYPLGDSKYLLDIECSMGMHDSEHIYYKLTDHGDTLEYHLLVLEQFDHLAPSSDPGSKPTNSKGEFVRFFDSLIVGSTLYDWENKPVMLQLDISASWGLRLSYDISGDCPKATDFQTRLDCSCDCQEEPWEAHPVTERKSWRTVPSTNRSDWKEAAPRQPDCQP